MAQNAPKTRDDLLPVVLGGDIGAYALGREFHEAYGVRSVYINTGYIGAITHSAIIDTHPVEAMHAGPVLEAIGEVASANADKTIALIANTDPLIELLEEVAGELPANVSVTIPPKDAFDAVCDKATFSRLCQDHGLDVPAMERVSLAGTSPIAPCQIPFPVVAKPAVSAGWYDMLLKGFKKVYYVTEQSQLDELWAGLRAAGFDGEILVQELIGGDDTYMDSLTIYIGQDGEARLLGAAQVLLEDHAPTMLGNPVAMVIRKKDELWEKAGRMLSDVGYRGFANFDVKRDPKDGRELFLDCNPRIGRNSFYNVAGGVNPMRVQVEDSIDHVASTQPLRAVEPALYTLVPVPLLRRYVRDPELLAEVDGLVRSGRVFDPQRYRADWGLRRRLDVELTELNQYRKFGKFYPRPTDTSF